jgi:hypothetical protein
VLGHIRVAQAIRLSRRLLAAEAPLDEGDGRVKPAVAREILVAGFGREPGFLGLGCCVEEGTAEAQGDDAVALPVPDQDRRLTPVVRGSRPRNLICPLSQWPCPS